MGKTAPQEREPQTATSSGRSTINKDHLPHRAALQTVAPSLRPPLPPSPSVVSESLDSPLSQQLQTMAGSTPTCSQQIALNSCLLCERMDSNLLFCISCESNFHPSCAHVQEAVASKWQCLLCSLESRTSIKNIYDYLAQVQKEPLAPIIAFYGNEIRRLKRVIHSLSPNDVVMGEADLTKKVSSVKPKKVILVGNDLRRMKKSVVESLPKKANLVFLPFMGSRSAEMLNEARSQVLSDENVHDLHIVYHPGSEECLQLEGTTLVHEVMEFATWLSNTSPTSMFSVISVPQIVKNESKAVNDELKKLSDGNKLQFIPLTMHQSELLRQGLRNYDTSMAERIGHVLARHISRYLGVTLVLRKPKQVQEPIVPPARESRHPARDTPRNPWTTPPIAKNKRRQNATPRVETRKGTPNQSGNSFRPGPQQINLADLIIGAIDRWKNGQQNRGGKKKPYRKR